MNQSHVKQCAIRGQALLEKRLRSGCMHVYFSIEELAEVTERSEREIHYNIRRIRDMIKKLWPGWHLHTINDDAVRMLGNKRDPSGIDCVPKGGKKVAGLRMIIKKDDPIYLEHCGNRDIYDDKRRNTHDEDTWRVHDDGLISLPEAKHQQRNRLFRLEELQVNGKVDTVLEKIQEHRHKNQPDQTERDRVVWRELSGSEVDTLAHLGVMLGEIVANRRVFASEVAFYIKKCPKQLPPFIQVTVEQEYGIFILKFYHQNPNTNFPRKQILGHPEPTRNIRKRLGMPYY